MPHRVENEDKKLGTREMLKVRSYRMSTHRDRTRIWPAANFRRCMEQ